MNTDVQKVTAIVAALRTLTDEIEDIALGLSTSSLDGATNVNAARADTLDTIKEILQ